MKRFISLFLILAMTASLCISGVSATTAEQKPYQVLECEENVYVEYNGADYTSNVITTVDGASGGKTVKTNLTPITWTITPDKTGYYTIDIVLKRTDTVLSTDNSTFTLDGTTVYEGVMTNWWGTCDTRIIERKLLTAGQSYSLAWATRPSSTISADYFNVYLEEVFEAESGTYSANLPEHYSTSGDAVSPVTFSGASGGSVAEIADGGSLRLPVTITERGWYSFDIMGTGADGVTGTIRIDEVCGNKYIGRTTKSSAFQLESGSGALALTQSATVMFMDKGSKTVSLTASGGAYSCDYVAIKQVAAPEITDGVIEAELYERSNDKSCTVAFSAPSDSYQNGTFLSGVSGTGLEFVSIFEVPEDGTYRFDVVGAADSTATDISIVFDDEATTLEGTIGLGDWKTKETFVGTATLSKGLHTLKFSAGKNLLNINAFLFQKMYECEENGVQVLVDGTDVTADCIVVDANASGGSYVSVSEGTISWSFTPTKTGYYTFDLATGGDASIMDGNSTFTINGETVFDGVVATNGAKNATGAKTTRIARKYLAGGSTHTITWASKPEGTVCPDYFNIYYEEPEKLILECEANNVFVNSNGTNIAADITFESSVASGGKYIRTSISPISWEFTPDKTGYYTFDLVTGGEAQTGDSTFTINDETVFTGVVATNSGWSVTNAPTTRITRTYLEAGTTYTIAWASRPTSTVCPDYFNVYYEPGTKEVNEYIIECEENVTINGEVPVAVTSGESTGIYTDTAGTAGYSGNAILSVDTSNFPVEWTITPEQTGKCSIALYIAGGSSGWTANNTFSVDGVEVATVAAPWTSGWMDGVHASYPDRDGIIATIDVTKGVPFTLKWEIDITTALRKKPDYFKITIEGTEEEEVISNATVLNAETDIDFEAGHGIGWYDTTPETYDDTYQVSDTKYHYVDVYSSTHHKGRCVDDAVAYMKNGEWFRYSIDVEHSGYYRIEVGIHTAICENNTDSKANFAVMVNGDGTTKTTIGVYRDAETYNWKVPDYYDFGLYWLNEGTNKIKVSFENNYNGYGNLDSIRITSPSIKLYKTTDTDDDSDIESGTERIEAETSFKENAAYTTSNAVVTSTTNGWSGDSILRRSGHKPESSWPFQVDFTAKVTGPHTFTLKYGGDGDFASCAQTVKVGDTTIYTGTMEASGGWSPTLEKTFDPITLTAGQTYTFTWYMSGGSSTVSIDYVDVAYTKETTNQGDGSATDEEVKFIAPGRYKAKADLTGWVKSDVAPVLYAAVYTSNGVLVNAKQTAVLEEEILTTGVVTVESGQYVKLFMWNDGDMKPLIDSKIYKP